MSNSSYSIDNEDEPKLNETHFYILFGMSVLGVAIKDILFGGILWLHKISAPKVRNYLDKCINIYRQHPIPEEAQCLISPDITREQWEILLSLMTKDTKDAKFSPTIHQRQYSKDLGYIIRYTSGYTIMVKDITMHPLDLADTKTDPVLLKSAINELAFTSDSNFSKTFTNFLKKEISEYRCIYIQNTHLVKNTSVTWHRFIFGRYDDTGQFQGSVVIAVVNSSELLKIELESLLATVSSSAELNSSTPTSSPVPNRSTSIKIDPAEASSSSSQSNKKKQRSLDITNSPVSPKRSQPLLSATYSPDLKSLDPSPPPSPTPSRSAKEKESMR
jgi:hypothetical protein